MRKLWNSFVLRLMALGVLLVICTNSSSASPYRQYWYQSGQVNFWPSPVAGSYYQSWTPGYAPAARSYRALTTSLAPTTSVPQSADYIPSVVGEGIYHWMPDKLPIKVWISDGEGVPGFRPQFVSFIRNGFDQWCQASGGKLAWKEVSSPEGADITVRWTNQVNQRPEGTEAGKTDALTRLNTATREGTIYGARMQILTCLPGRPFSDAEVAKTCLHETGHAVGLQGHSPYRDDIMYYAVSANRMPTLSNRDRNTISHLYANYPAVDSVALSDKQ